MTFVGTWWFTSGSLVPVVDFKPQRKRQIFHRPYFFYFFFFIFFSGWQRCIRHQSTADVIVDGFKGSRHDGELSWTQGGDAGVALKGKRSHTSHPSTPRLEARSCCAAKRCISTVQILTAPIVNCVDVHCGEFVRQLRGQQNNLFPPPHYGLSSGEEISG